MGTLAKDIPISYPNFNGHLKVIWTFWLPFGNANLMLAVLSIQY